MRKVAPKMLPFAIFSVFTLISNVTGDFLQQEQSENANIQKLYTRIMPLYGETLDDARYLPHEKLNKSKFKLEKDDTKFPEISEFLLVNDTHVFALLTWTHFDSKVVYILTCNKVKKSKGRSYCIGESNVYRSKDYGTTFAKESYKLKNQSQISSIYTSPTDRKVIIMNDQKSQIIYSSENEGESFHARKVTFTPLSTTFHPKLANYILVQDTQSNIYITNNTGKDWNFVCANVNSFFMADKGSRYELFFEVRMQSQGKFSKGNYSAIFMAEIPFDGQVKELSHEFGPIDQNSLMVKDNYIFIWRKTSTGNSHLFVSYKKKPFKECQLSTHDSYIQFHIIEASEGEIMLAALNKSGLTNLFISDKTGTKFAVAFKNIKASWKSEKPIIDLHQVSGLPGTLLANHVDKGTFISYNKGGSWSPLRPPSYGIQRKSTECMLPDCELRLTLYIRDSYAAGWSPVTSSKSAPGIIIAQGWLQYKTFEAAMYLSSYASYDGGQTWKQILKGRQVVKLLDHGGIIAAIPLTNGFSLPEMNKLDYTCDGGESWTSVDLSKTVKRLIGVAAHPAAKASLLSIFAVDVSQGKKMTWNVWRVNFTSIFDYKCHPDNYTLWTASSDSATGACILGQRFVYNRRKKSICCSNGLDYRPFANISTCECTLNDFDCDFGFKRERFGSLCVATSLAAIDPPANCPEGGNYVRSKGYTKVIGDRCKGGIIDEIKPIVVQCPARAPDGLSLSVKRYSIALGKSAVIILNQKSGFLGTKYTWDFGDNVKKYNLSFEEARTQNHTYQQVGTYIIELFAFNKAGSYTAKTVLRVIERVSEIFLRVTKPVVANEEAVYTVTVKTHGKKVEQLHGFVHFAWIFEPIKTPVLSLNSSVGHTYSKPGTYEVEVQVFNAISVVSTTTAVTVFGDVRVISLQFSSTLDLLNTGDQAWNDKFKLYIHEYLTAAFNIRKDMVEVDVSKTLPTIVTLSLVQNQIPQTGKQSKPQKSIDEIMHLIIQRVRSKKIVFFLYGQEIRVLSATIIRDKKVAKTEAIRKPKPSSVKKYLYIGVPIGIIFVVVILCFGHRIWKRKHSSKPNVYLQMQDENDQSRLQQFGLDDFEQT